MAAKPLFTLKLHRRNDLFYSKRVGLENATICASEALPILGLPKGSHTIWLEFFTRPARGRVRVGGYGYYQSPMKYEYVMLPYETRCFLRRELRKRKLNAFYIQPWYDDSETKG